MWHRVTIKLYRETRSMKVDNSTKKMKFIRWTLIYKRSRNINNSVWKLQANAPKRSEWTIIISVMCARDGNNTYVSISTADECKHLRWISWSKSHHCMEQWIFFVEFRLTRKREKIKIHFTEEEQCKLVWVWELFGKWNRLSWIDCEYFSFWTYKNTKKTPAQKWIYPVFWWRF